MKRLTFVREIVLVLVLVNLGLAGCQSFRDYKVEVIADNNPALAPDINRLIDRYDTASAGQVVTLNEITSTPETMRQFLSGTTVRTYSYLHGTQIEALLADGRTLLWYPGNSRLVPGQWITRPGGRRTQMCFRYGLDSYNPVTNTAGGDWECGPARLYLLGTEEIISGDPLQLSTSGMPFVLERENLSLAGAMSRVGRSTTLENKVNW